MARCGSSLMRERIGRSRHTCRLIGRWGKWRSNGLDLWMETHLCHLKLSLINCSSVHGCFFFFFSFLLVIRLVYTWFGLSSFIWMVLPAAARWGTANVEIKDPPLLSYFWSVTSHQGHIRTNHTFKVFLYQFQTQVIKSQVSWKTRAVQRSLFLSLVEFVYGGGGWWLFPRLRGFWENVSPFIPRLRFFFFIKCRLARAHYFHSLCLDRPQWLSELRRLWPDVPRQVVYELVSG